MSVIVFDMGGTLMEYIGMPLSWTAYYSDGFKNISEAYSCNATVEEINKSIEIMTGYNARVVYREIEYTPQFIFEKCLNHWQKSVPIEEAVDCFFKGLCLRPKIYPEAPRVLKELKARGHITAALTDLPTAMPDSLFKHDAKELLSLIDIYVSSQSCGYRKPNKRGIEYIAERCSCDVESIIFVGDEEKDRQTAQNAGCRFIHISRAEKAQGGIKTLEELLNLTFKSEQKAK